MKTLQTVIRTGKGAAASLLIGGLLYCPAQGAGVVHGTNNVPPLPPLPTLNTAKMTRPMATSSRNASSFALSSFNSLPLSGGGGTSDTDSLALCSAPAVTTSSLR